MVLAQLAEHRLVIPLFFGGSDGSSLLRLSVLGSLDGCKIFVDTFNEEPDLQIICQGTEFAQPEGVSLGVRDSTVVGIIVTALLHPLNDEANANLLGMVR